MTTQSTIDKLIEMRLTSMSDAVSYTHLDVYKRQTTIRVKYWAGKLLKSCLRNALKNWRGKPDYIFLYFFRIYY